MSDTISRVTSPNPILLGIRGELSILKKVFVVAPLQATVSVMLSIVARITGLLTMVLPLKSIMVAASPEVPGFILAVLPNADKNSVVIGLGLLTVVFYFLDLYVDKLSDQVAERGAAAVVRRANKINPVIDIQAETTAQFKNLVRIQSAILFGILLGAVLSLFYLRLALVTVGVLAAIFVALVVLCADPSMRARLYDARVVVQSRVAFVVTMLVFMMIVFDTLTGYIEALLAIIGLIVSRQLLNAIGEYARLTINLNGQRARVENLFFHAARTTLPTLPKSQRGFWGQLSLATAEPAIAKALTDILGRSVVPSRVAWRDTGLFDIACFDVEVRTEPGADAELYLIKIYKENRRLAVAHEELLLASKTAAGLPAPRLFGRTEIDDCSCLVMARPGEQIEDLLDYKNALIGLLGDIWATPVPASISGPFLRSTPCAVGDLTTSLLERVLIGASDSADRLAVSELMTRLDEVKAVVLGLPMAIHNPDLSSAAMARRDGARPVGLHWARWMIEPVGTALWTIEAPNQTELAAAVAKMVKSRKDCAHLSVDHLLLAAYLHKLLRQCNRQSYTLACKTAGEVLTCFAAVKVSRAA